MKRLIPSLTLTLLLSLALAPSASGAFGLKEVEMRFEDRFGNPALQAGSHPFAVKTTIAMNTRLIPEGGSCIFPECDLPDGQVEDLTVTLPEGFAGNPRAVPPCPTVDFLEREIFNHHTGCSDETVLGINSLRFAFDPVEPGVDEYVHAPVYNLAPPPGTAARIGFAPLGVPVTVDFTLKPTPPYNVIAHATNIPQVTHFYDSLLTVWGDPASPLHDPLRGNCLAISASPREEPKSTGLCPVQGEDTAFITLPRSCEGEPETHFGAKQWDLFVAPDPVPGATDTEVAQSEELLNCPALGFGPEISARPSTERPERPTGLQFALRIKDPNIANPSEEAIAHSDIRKAVITLPEGMTINPSQAEGLKVCAEHQLDRETVTSQFGAGCPAASKIGSIEAESPLLEEEVFNGTLFVAKPRDNLADDSLIAFYIVIKDPELGLLVKQAAKVEPDPETGQLITTTEDMPQLPISDVRLRFREGGRSPLITPPRCGSYEVEAVFTPWSASAQRATDSSSFRIKRGAGPPCPPKGLQPFEPGLAAGTLSNAAATHSPFHLRLTRRDGDQDLVRFDATLPRGVVAKLAGVPFCGEAAIASIETRTGKQELADPACPAASEIGSVQAGAGVGSQLLYVPGSVYLAGPFGGAPLSVIGVVPAVAGPFDVGVVATRQALVVDPVTAEVRADGSLSEPIPHILEGIPVRVRDIQVSVDRPQFTLNPTSCRKMETAAAIWGGGLDPFSLLDNAPVPRTAPFQAASCAALGFKPRLSFLLRGGIRRGANPAFRAVLRPRPGDANLRRTVVRFPSATFLDQGHIRTVCTRVQFAANACPPGSIYGQVKAFTPLLAEPLQGPVYLRSSDNLLPDIVFDLKGLVDFEAAARADSVKGRLRVTFPAIPDAPVSRVIVDMQGGKKGLLVNSRNICASPKPRAGVDLTAHNDRHVRLRPVMRSTGCKKRR